MLLSNIPVCVVVFFRRVLARRGRPARRAAEDLRLTRRGARHRWDAALVYAQVTAPVDRCGTARTLGELAVAGDLLAAFLYNEHRHRNPLTEYARAAGATGQLAVSEAECRDIVFATMDGALWHRLVAQRGWSDERFAERLGTLWVSQLVKSRCRARK